MVYILVPVQFVESVNLFLCSLSGLILAFFPHGGEPLEPSSDYTLIELTGTDRPGLLSEVSAVLTNLECNVVNSELWTQNERAAAVMQVTDTKSGLAISDAERKYVVIFVRELL